MRATVIGATTEVDLFSSDDLKNSKVFSRKNADICYLKDSYFNSPTSSDEKAVKRFQGVAKKGHHSIADHVNIEVLFENISKMLAIVLNSLQDYATSEKSGRYTVMTGNSAEEQNLYDKWRGIFRKRILDVYPDIDDDVLYTNMSKIGHPDVIISNGELSNNSMSDYDDIHRDCLMKIKNTCELLPSVKLAQENARYMLSVFTKSTTMGYTASLRQWNYIYDWCQKYINSYYYDMNEEYFKWEVSHGEEGNFVLRNKSTSEEASYFERRLYFDLLELSNFIFDNLYVDELRDMKNRCFDFLTNLSGDSNHPMAGYHVMEPDILMGRNEDIFSNDDYLGITYSVSYPASFVHIAQAERHRTLKYFMKFNPSYKNPEFFVPKIIRGTDLEKKWLSDLDTIKDLIPQATMVGIIETGHISDFILKCQERLCGRAQLEIMEQTEKTAKRFIEMKGKGNKVLDTYVEQLGSTDKIATKCKLNGVCKEPCNWIKDNKVFTRFI